MNPMSQDHAKLRHALINKLDLFDDRSVRDNEIAEAVGKLIKERDEFFERVSAQLQIPQGEDIAYASYVEIFESVKELRYERDAALERSDAGRLLEHCKQASEKYRKFSYDEEDIPGMTLGDIPKLVAYSFQARNEIVDLTKRVTSTPDEALKLNKSERTRILESLVGEHEGCDLDTDYICNTIEGFHTRRDELIKERDEALKFRDEYHAQLMGVATRLGDPGAFFSSLPSEITKLHTEMARVELACENYRELLARPDATQPQLNGLMCDELLDRLGLDAGYTSEQFHASMKVLFNDLSTLQEQVEALKTDIEYRRTAQLSEIRYVLHGDIQPCSVLYSDDTTTLLRLDEGDMMLETDTIEWSDSVTYRCQELLKSSGLNKINLVRVSGHLAQLVRDERILLNDDAGLEDEAVEQPTAVVPAPPPFGHEKPDHNNPYVHTTTLFTEEAMRSHGWTSEALVSCGHGHYAPAQPPADTAALDRPAEWTDNNSPTPLR